MSEDKIDAESLAENIRERIADADRKKVEVSKGIRKVVDIPVHENNKWSIIGSEPSLPVDMEVVSQVSPDVPLIAVKEENIDKNLMAIKVKNGAVQIKPLSESQEAEVQELDDNDNIIRRGNVGPMRSTEQRYDVFLPKDKRVMVYLGPEKYPVRMFQKVVMKKMVTRLIFNPQS